MQSFILVAGLVSILASTTVASKIDLRNVKVNEPRQNDVISQCVEKNDCCFSTIGACRRQSSDILESWVVCPLVKLCPALGVSVQSCNADCCSIETKWGRGCPGK